jgi:hypothetical protein
MANYEEVPKDEVYFMKKSIVFLFVLILSVTAVHAGLVGFLTGQVISEVTGNYIAGGCAKDIKVCPDGNYVARLGPNCEFISCPKPACGDVYSPVCGQPECVEGSKCEMMGVSAPQTYSNECVMKYSGASLLYKGECKSEPVCGNGICESNEDNFCPPHECMPGANCPIPNCLRGTCPQDCSNSGCAEDIQICPDGSKVVRDPENGCNFMNCPDISCGIINIYSEQVPGYVYHNFFIEAQGRLEGNEYGITGADNWNNLKFAPYMSSGSGGSVGTRFSEKTVLKATQTLNSQALSYIMNRQHNIKLTYGGNPICNQPLPQACDNLPCFFDGTSITNTWSTVDSPPNYVSANYPYQFNLEEKSNVKLNLRYELWSANDYSTNQMIIKVDGKTAFKISGSQSEVKEITIGELSRGNHFIEIYATPDPNHFHFDWFELTGKPVDEVSCIDNDGGKNYYVASEGIGPYSLDKDIGVIWGENRNNCGARWDNTMDTSVHYDCCSNYQENNQLNEAYCNENGILMSEGYNCPNGCYDGACIQDTYSCDTLSLEQIYKNAYENCLSAGHNFMCFNKYGGDFQGCVNDINECSGNLNTNAEKNIACKINRDCPEIYSPVCGQPPMPDCPAGAACQMVEPNPKTYSNECEMNNADAKFLYKGKCEPDVMCKDSDNGDNQFVKGYRVNYNPEYFSYLKQQEDYCILNPTIRTGGSVISDGDKRVESCQGDNCYVIEYHCRDDLSDAHTGIKCENGCADGACIKKEPLYRNAYWQCYDGVESNEGGPTSCKSSETWSAYAQESCKGHCTIKTCNDRCDFTDDGVIDNRDITEIRNRFRSGDIDLDVDKNGKVDQSDILYCSRCVNTKCGVNSFSVSNSCSDVTQKCTDSDGGKDFYNKGTITLPDPHGKITDYCKNDTYSIVELFEGEYINEMICSGQGYTSAEYRCPNGCRDGACKPKKCDVDDPSLMKDEQASYYINGKNYKLSIHYSDPMKIKFMMNNDYSNFLNVGESYTFTDGSKITLNKIQIMDNQSVDRVGICFIAGEVSNTCKDSDGGINEFVKGITYDPIFTEGLADFCSNGNTLEEYFCGNFDENVWDDGTIWPTGKYATSNSIKCEGGCNDGACVPEIKIELCTSDSECAIACIKAPCSKGVCINGQCEIEDQIIVDCELICKNKGTKSEGWYNSCTGELNRYANCGAGGDNSCNGCRIDDKCYPYGIRKDKEFCNLEGDFDKQFRDGKICQNNYECLTNACVSGECTDLAGEIRETRSMIERLFEFFKNFF